MDEETGTEKQVRVQGERSSGQAKPGGAGPAVGHVSACPVAAPAASCPPL